MERAIDLDNVTRAIEQLPAVPAVVNEINCILASPSVSAAAVAKAVERDQAVTVKLLRLANSAFFGCRGQVGSVSHAVILMGFSLLRNVVLSCAIKNALGHKGLMSQRELDLFWDHAFACGLIARRIAGLAHVDEPDEAFLGGLLHDVGQIVLAAAFGKTYLQLLRQAASEKDLLEAEISACGVDHSAAGRLLAEKWNLPEMVCRCVAEHHQNGKIFSPVLPYVVGLSERVTCQIGRGGFCKCGGSEEVAPESWPRAEGLDLDKLKAELDQALSDGDR